MPTRTFAITQGTNSVEYKGKTPKTVTFTVTNKSPQTLTTQAVVVPVASPPAPAGDSAAPPWVSLEGDAEASLTAGTGTHQFAVRIAVPSGTPAGTYSFRLDAKGVENPDEFYTEGPTVSVVVPESAPVPTPDRKWLWWVLAAVGGLILIGILILLLSGGEPEPEPEPVAAIPGVVNKKLYEAQMTLLDAGLVPIVGSAKGSSPAGTVAEQEPTGGAPRADAIAVTVFPSKTQVTVPDVRNGSEADARRKLREAGLRPGLVSVVKKANGRVWRITHQNPRHPAKAAANSAVALTLTHQPLSRPASKKVTTRKAAAKKSAVPKKGLTAVHATMLVATLAVPRTISGIDAEPPSPGLLSAGDAITLKVKHASTGNVSATLLATPMLKGKAVAGTQTVTLTGKNATTPVSFVLPASASGGEVVDEVSFELKSSDQKQVYQTLKLPVHYRIKKQP